MVKKKSAGGEPDVSRETLGAVLNHIAMGITVSRACREAKVDRLAVLKIAKHDEVFAEKLEDARSFGLDAMEDEIIDISDDSIHETYEDDSGILRQHVGMFQAHKLRVESRKFMLKSLRREKFGDRMEVEANTKSTVQVESIQRTIVDPNPPSE